jgi:hypothetical protein
MKRVTLAGLVALATLATTPSLAAEKTDAPPPAPEPTSAPAKDSKKKKEGWTNSLIFSLNTSLATSSNVVGKPDGTTFSLGVSLVGKFEYRRGGHEWLNNLNLQLQTTRTPLIDEFVKSLDQLKLETLYAYFPVSWFGIYMAVSFETSLFPGEDVRPDNVNYNITPAGCTTADCKTTQSIDRLELTSAFSPTFLNQSAGLKFKFIDRTDVSISFRAGVGVVEALTRDGLVITKATKTDVDVQQLSDYVEAGVVTRLDISGKIKKWLAYTAYAELLFPFYSSRDLGPSEPSELDQVAVDMSLKLKFRISDWFSLDYVVGARRMPLIEDSFQIWTGLLASFTVRILGG